MTAQTKLELENLGLREKIGQIEINVPESFPVPQGDDGRGPGHIKVNRAAKNNLPDEASFRATKSIVDNMRDSIGSVSAKFSSRIS